MAKKSISSAKIPPFFSPFDLMGVALGVVGVVVVVVVVVVTILNSNSARLDSSLFWLLSS